MIYMVVAAAISFAVTYASMPPLIRLLKSRGMSVPDVHKKGRPMIVRPGGPAMLAGIIPAMLFVFWYTGNWGALAVLATAGMACAIGYVDDIRTMGGWFKPACLAAASIPIILAGSYDTTLIFPLFGGVQIPILYLGVIVAMIPITGNTVNSIDVMNGVASGYIAMATGAVMVVLVMLERWDAAALAAVLLAMSLAFYRYHRMPSHIFPGDSGALLLGATYGGVAIVGGVEVVSAVALLPAIANSFFFLASTRRVVEYRQIKRKDVIQNNDMTLRDSGDPAAPISLVRLILRRGPMNESQVVRELFRMGAFSSALAVLTGIMMLIP